MASGPKQDQYTVDLCLRLVRLVDAIGVFDAGAGRAFAVGLCFALLGGVIRAGLV